MPTFGENLKRIRGDLSQEKLGERLGHKRPGTVQSWEKGRRTPRLASVKKIADALGCRPEDLLLGVPNGYGDPSDEDELIAEAIEILREADAEDRKRLVALLRPPAVASRGAERATESHRAKPQTRPGTTRHAVRRR